MAVTRKIRSVQIDFDDSGVVGIDIRTLIEATDPDNPDRVFTQGEAVHELLDDLTETQRTTIGAFVSGVVEEILSRKSPIVE